MSSHHRLVVVREDGLSHSSDFSGWHSETGAFHYFNAAKAEEKTLYAVVYHSTDTHRWYPRSEYKRADK